MPPHRPRLVRRAPLSERIKAYLNPLDFLLWASEELNGNDWDDFDKKWAMPTGVVLNVIFMLARANASGPHNRGDEVFADYHERRGSGWLSWFSSILVYLLALFSFLNTLYTFTRKRHYRLFESNVDVAPTTPSARRVRVDSSPLSSSPLRFLSSMIASTTAESRAHPDAARDVWEISLWDPTPFCLRLFCLFSPGHIMVYCRFLPLAVLDPRPSVTVVTTMFLAILVSAQLLVFQKFFSQQAKDSSLIHKEVQNEYDIKYVHPMVNRPVRDVGTQMLSGNYSRTQSEVMTYTPTTYVNRGFRTNPNPTYAPHYDPDGIAKPKAQSHLTSQSMASPIFRTPNTNRPMDLNTPTRPSTVTTGRQSQFRSTSTGAGDGGSFGIYNHAHSPLKKVAPGMINSPRSSVGLEGTRERSSFRRESSPLKRSNYTDSRDSNTNDRLGHLRGAQ